MKSSLLSAVPLALVLMTTTASAELADRNLPVNIEADRITVDEAKKVQIFEGNVQLTQGTMVLHAARLVVTQDAGGYQKGIAYGTDGHPASFRQKREGKAEYIEGEADRIEHDGRQERTELFKNALIRSGLDEVHGQYISYDAKTENYVVSGTIPDATATSPSSTGRVRAVIQPKRPPENSSTTTK